MAEPSRAAKEPKLPKSLGACADLLYKTREERLKLQREVDRLEKKESALENHFIEELSKDSTGVAGRVARVQINSKPVPVVEDWSKFYTYIKKNNAFELLQRRLSAKAVEERWEDKKQVPGVGRFNAKKVSCTKLKGKR